MYIIVQPKRILIPEFPSDKALTGFIKMNTIIDYDINGNISKEWVSLYETTYKGKTYLAIPKRFPKGILYNFIGKYETIMDNAPNKSYTREITNNFSAKNIEQEKIIDFLIGQNKYKDIYNKPRRALFAETGAGKTFSTLKTIATKSLFTFINCPDEKAILTWKQEIAKFTDIQPDEIYTVAGRPSIPKLLKDKDSYKLVLGSSKTFSSLINSGDYNLIEDFFNEMKFGLLVHDEAHLNLNVLFHLEMITNTPNTFYLTATPGRRIYKEKKLLEILLPSDKYIYAPDPNPKYKLRKCVYYSNPSPEHTKGLSKPRGFDYLNYGKRIIFNDKLPYKSNFEDCLYRVVRAARKAITDKENNKIAIICKTKAENESIYKFINKEFPDLSVGLFNSDIVNMDERYEETNRNIIVSTDKSFAGIINISRLEAIIMIYPMSSNEHLLQIAGRIRTEPNKKALIYILADYSFNSCKKTLYRACKVLEPFLQEEKLVYLNERENQISVDLT